MSYHDVRDSKSLIKFIEENTAYKIQGPHFQYGQLSNGAFISSLLNFLDDNQGAVDLIVEFMENNGFILNEDNDDDDESEQEFDKESESWNIRD